MERSAACRSSDTRSDNVRRMVLGAALLAVVAAPAVAHAEPAPDALYGALQRSVTAASSRSDLDAIVAEVGAEPKLLAAWVATNVRWEPYAGILRGAGGTAAARAGNAIDQALLLQALLERAGVKATIMSRALSQAERKAQLAAFLASDGKAGLADAPRLGTSAAAELAHPDAAAAIDRLRGLDDAAVNEALAAAQRTAPELVAALGKALRPRRVDAPREHYWVEVAGEALDPSAPDLDHGRAKPVDARALERLGHTLVVSLVMKRTRDGKGEEETLLQVPVALDAAAWAPIELTIRPEPAKLGMTTAQGRKDPKALAGRLAKAPILRGSLLVGGERHGAAGFDRNGVRYDVGTDGEVGGPAQLGAALGGAFGGFGGFGGGGKPKPEAGAKLAFVAVVLRVEVRGPGEANNPERVHERVLVTPAPDELPVVRVSLLAENLALAPGERELSTARALLATKPALDALVAGDKGAADKLAAPSEPAPTLMRYADLRRRVQAQLAAGGASQHFRERTGLVAMIERLVATSDGELVAQSRFDIFANPVAYVTSKGELDAAAAVAQGVADTALEAALLGPKTAADRRGTAWAMLADAAGAPKVIKSGGVLKVAWSDAAWWSVDPRSGAAVGRVPGGGGQAMVEYAKKVSDTVCNWGWVLAIFASANPENPYHVGDASTFVSRFCSVMTGTEAQQIASEHIGEINNALWKIAIPAMVGLPAKK